MPRDDALEFIDLTDFSPGIFSNNNLAGGINVTSDNPCKAQEDGTYRCIALPTGGLGPLPRRVAEYGLTTIPDSASGVTYQVAGFEVVGRILPSPSSDLGGQGLEAHVMLYYQLDGGGGTFDPHLMWLRERLFDSGFGTETIEDKTLSGVGSSSARYSYFLPTRMNPAAVLNPGVPVVVGISTRSANNDIIMDSIWPDPAAPSTNATIDINGVSTVPYVIAATHQGRVVLGVWSSYDHGVDSDLITNENMVWTNVNTNTISTTTPAVFLPELDQTITDMASMSANAFLVIKALGGGYVLQGDLDDVTVVQLPNLPSPDSTNVVRGVNTSSGYIYSAGINGMYKWNGGDSAELISPQLHGTFAVDHLPGQCDRILDLVLVPGNWVFDSLQQGWWRLEDPDDVSINFWSTSANGRLMGATTSFTAAAPTFMYAYQRGALAYSWSWKSHPLWISQGRYMDVRQGVVALQGEGTVSITLTDEAGNTSEKSITITDGPIRNFRFDLAMTAENLTITIDAQGTTDELGVPAAQAPLLHRLFLGYRPAQHLRNVDN